MTTRWRSRCARPRSGRPRGEVVRFDVRGRFDGGELLTVDLQLAPLRDASGPHYQPDRQRRGCGGAGGGAARAGAQPGRGRRIGTSLRRGASNAAGDAGGRARGYRGGGPAGPAAADQPGRRRAPGHRERSQPQRGQPVPARLEAPARRPRGGAAAARQVAAAARVGRAPGGDQHHRHRARRRGRAASHRADVGRAGAGRRRRG